MECTNLVPDVYPKVNFGSLEEFKLYFQVMEDCERFEEHVKRVMFVYQVGLMAWIIRGLVFKLQVSNAYPKVNVESLEETKFYLEVVEYREWFGEVVEDPDSLSSNPTNIIEGIKNVKSLTLSSSFFLRLCF